MNVRELMAILSTLPEDARVHAEAISGGCSGELEDIRFEADYYGRGGMVVIDVT